MVGNLGCHVLRLLSSQVKNLEQLQASQLSKANLPYGHTQGGEFTHTVPTYNFQTLLHVQEIYTQIFCCLELPLM